MAKKVKFTDSDLITCMTNYRNEADQARQYRIQQNRINFDAYQLQQDWNYKQIGQSREYLPKVAMAVEQSANFLQQGLVEPGEWFKVAPAPGLIEDMMKIKPEEVRRLLERQLQKNDFYTFAGNSFKAGLLGSLMICKVGGKYVTKPIYKAKNYLTDKGEFKTKLTRKEDKVWQLELSLVRQENFYPDPNGNLYKVEDIFMDYHEVVALAEEGVYDKKVVKELKGTWSSEGTDKQFSKSRETGLNVSNQGYRNRVKVTEVWGTIINSNGEVVMDDCYFTVANDTYILQQPTKYPAWYNQDPYVVVPILTVPHSVWGKALMDAPAMLNRACNEMFNLMLDGGLMAVHGIKQIREHWLEDPAQVEEGIPPGTTLRVNQSCPPGMSALERVDTSSVPQEGFNMFNLLNQELYTAAMTNDLRMGVASFRQVKATEVVEASQSITSMFNGLGKVIEEKYITAILEKGWMTTAQCMNDLDQDEVRALLGEARADALLSMGNEEIFVNTVQGLKFEVFGISANLNKMKDFMHLQALLQTIASSPVLMEGFAQKYDFNKLLTEIMLSLDLNPSKLLPNVDKVVDGMQAMGQMQADQGLPNMQSQIPQTAANMGSEDANAIPQVDFPGSRATPAAG